MNPAEPHDRDAFAPSAPLENLRRRADLLRRLRKFFEERGFWEVETPLLSADTVVDRHLDPLPVTLFDDAREPQIGRTQWLQTSPEFGMKRLLAAGADAIFQVTRAFRGGERGRLHNPEFTIVEWYRLGDDLRRGMDLLSDLAESLLSCGRAKRITYRQAFWDHVQLDSHTATIDELIAAATRHGQHPPESFDRKDRDAWLDWLLTERVEPKLGLNRPTILHDYPPSQAALAKIRDDEPPVAERFELYFRGVELANGYRELCDPAVLIQRNRIANRQRAADGRYLLPDDSRLLAAMRHGLPESTGCALGFDRLVMLALGATDIAQVMAFPSEIA